MSYQCAKCHSSMEEGFLLEKGHYNDLSSEVWVSGSPDEKSFLGGITIKGKVTYNVRTFRCTNCGYLESYAR
jgi:hypothetical protein